MHTHKIKFSFDYKAIYLMVLPALVSHGPFSNPFLTQALYRKRGKILT